LVVSELILATRGSALALWQTRHVAALLEVPAVERVIETRGDVDRTPVLAGRLEKGFFTQELEQALLEGRVSAAVHSLKDLPTVQPKGLCLGAVLARADVRDFLIVRREAVEPREPHVLPLKAGARVGASSLRRMALIRAYGAQTKSEPLRGNVPTRISKLGRGDYEAIVLAAAGVTRLEIDLSAFAVFGLNPRVWIPAPGQGAIAVQCREDDAATRAALATIDHAPTRTAVDRERLMLQAFEGGCSAPFGCLAEGEVAHLGMERDGRWGSTRLSLPMAMTLEEGQSILNSLSVLEVHHDAITQSL
jgi:hydroxymethylbilane synthase